MRGRKFWMYSVMTGALLCGTAVARASVGRDDIAGALKIGAGPAKDAIETWLKRPKVVPWFTKEDGTMVTSLLLTKTESGTRMFPQNVALDPFRERARQVRLHLHNVKPEFLPMAKFMIKGDAKGEPDE